MIPALFIGVSFGVVAVNATNNQNFLQIRADSPELTAFLTRFNEIRTQQNANGKTICDTTKEEYEEMMNLKRSDGVCETLKWDNYIRYVYELRPDWFKQVCLLRIRKETYAKDGIDPKCLLLNLTSSTFLLG